MSASPAPRAGRGWRTLVRALYRVLYRALLVFLPRTLRRRHGAAMLDLFTRDLDRRAGARPFGMTCTALAGIGDLVWRGCYERAAEERRAVAHDGWAPLRATAAAFGVAFTVMTAVLLLQYARRHGVSLAGGRALALVLCAAPFTAALTMPMAVFTGALWGMTRGDGTDTNAKPDAVPAHRRSPRVAPLVAMAAVVGVLAFGLNAEVVPRANERLLGILSGRAEVPPTDRTMTLTALRAQAARLAAAPGAPPTRDRPPRREALASIKAEIHKKFALPAACVLLVLLAAGIARRAPRAGVPLQVAVNAAVFGGYYLLLVGGETLADQLLVPPAVAIWSANLLALAVAAALAAIPAAAPPRTPCTPATPAPR